jgi:hypothetical protein
MTDTQIVHNYRLDRESIYELCHELEAELARPTRRVHALPVSLQVMIALRYFASGSYMNVIGDAHGVSKTSVSPSGLVRSRNSRGICCCLCLCLFSRNNATAILPRGFSLLKWFICDLRVVMSNLSVKKNICV